MDRHRRHAGAATVTTRRLGFFSPDGDGHDDTAGSRWTSSAGTAPAPSASSTVRDVASGSGRSLTGSRGLTTWTGRDDAGTIVPGRPLHLPGRRRDRAGNVTISDKPVLVDRTIKLGHAGRTTRSTRATARRSRLPVSLRRSATVTVAHLPRHDAGPPDLDRQGAGRRQPRLDLERQDGGGAYVKRRHAIGSWSAPRARSARRAGPGPSRSRSTEPGRAPYTAGHDRARRRPGPGPGSCCRPTTRPTTSARSRRRSSTALPGATLLVVDDGSPDGTGDLADELAAADPRIRVRHRPAKQGLGRPTSTASASPSTAAPTTSSRWTPTSPRPGGPAGPPRPDRRRRRPTSSSARATRRAAASSTGASAGGSSRAAAACSRGSSSACRPNDLTGGFKAWRATTLAAIPFDGVHAGGYVFQIEMTFRAEPRRGAHRRGPDHLPRPARRPEQDVAADHRRGARRRRPAPGSRSCGTPPPCGGRRRRRPGRDGRAAASASSSTPGRSRTPSAPRSPRPTSTGCWPPSTPTRSTGESFAFLLPSDLDDPTDPLERLEVDRAAAPARRPGCSAPRALTRRPVPPARRVAGRGLAGRARRRAGAVYHAVGGGPLPIASGLPVVVTLLDLAPWELPETFQRPAAGALRAAPAGAPAARRGGGHRRRPTAVGARRAPAAPRRAATGSTSCRSRRDRPTRRRAGDARRASAPREAEADRRAARAAASATSSIRAATTPARTSPTLLAALARWPRPAGRRTCPRRSPGRRASSLVGRQPGRPRGPRPGRGPPGRRRGPGLRPAPAGRPPRRAGPRRARPRSCRSSPRRPGWPPSRRSRPGRRSSPPRSAPCPSSSARPASSSSRATRIAWPSRCATSGPTTRPRPASSTAARERADRDRRTWADVAARRRAPSTPRSATAAR